MAEREKIITVNFKSSAEIDDLFQRLLQVHPQSESFKRYFDQYINHHLFVTDLKRRLNQINKYTIDLICFSIEQTSLTEIIKRLPALAHQPDDWIRYRFNLTLLKFQLSDVQLAPTGWHKSDPVDRIQFCQSMFEQISAQPSTFAVQWTTLRKAQPEIQTNIVQFLGRTTDKRAILFLKAYAQCEDVALARQSIEELGRRRDSDTLTFVEHFWKHHRLDEGWQPCLLIALRRIYLLPEETV